MIHQRDVWWANLRSPLGSEPGSRRPVIVVQGDIYNQSRINTVVVVPLTTNLRLAGMPGNVVIRAGEAQLDHDSVANVSQIVTVDRSLIDQYVGSISTMTLDAIFAGLDAVLAR